jgi:hypothetical protein
VVALLAAACSRGSDTAATEPAPTSRDTATTASGRRLDQGGFGSLRSVCSDGDAEPVRGVPGVDGTTIRVGTFSDVGFAGRPGINQELFDTAEAVTKWCNDHGGVRGYRIESNLHDAAVTNFAARMADACREDFFLVGGGAAFDDTGQEARLDCSLPDMSAYSVNTKAADADLVLTSLPNPEDQLAIPELVYAQRRWPDLVDKTAILSIAIPATRVVRDRYLEVFDHLGWEAQFLGDLAPLGEPTYAPLVQAMKSRGIELVLFIGEPASLAAIQRAAADADWRPTAWLPSTNAYDRTYIPLAQNAARDTFLRSLFWPIEDADANDATTDYVSLLKSVDGKVALLGLQGMSMWMLFLTSLGSCIDSGTLSRDCVYREAAKATAWTGGGLHAPADVTRGSAPTCYVMLAATPDGWVRAPRQTLGSGGYDCNAKSVDHLRRDYGEGARCPSGVANPLPSTCR